MLRSIIIFFFFFFLENTSFSKDEYFLTLRNETVNLRQGPSFEYPIKIIYKKKFLPVLIKDEHGTFRKVKDHENNSGWIHISQLSKRKAALVKVKNIVVFSNPTLYSKPLVVLNEGRLCLIIKCQSDWCKISVDTYKGWVKQTALRGRL
ncbi:SH3 domain-containing protein [Candidatus Pelagibacter bacterium]|nr:SH3 domain-containing protein [Candidatus Pelagibacter bacterium]MDA9624774.1 SH3 domain-containing protein [Candidatus Pelagibacter bacterium]